MSQPSSITIKVIPGELDSAQFHVLAEFDSEKADFQLDTGATYTSVSNTPFTEKYKVTGHMKRTSASGKVKSEEKITLNTFSLGNIIKKNFEVVRYEAARNQENRLGMNFIGDSKFKMDLKNWLIDFEKTDFQILKEHDLDLYIGNTFGFQVKIGQTPIKALWDTGAELSAIDKELINSHPMAFKFIQKIENGTDATGEPIAFDLYEIKNFEIAGHTISGTLMSMDFHMIKEKVGPQIKFILGTNLIRNHIWYFDIPNKKWAFEK